MISTEFFRANRERLRTLFAGMAPIVITANGLLQCGGDSTYLFRQDSSFWYLTGIDEPDIILVIDKANEYLIVPERGSSREAFDGAINIKQLTAISGIETVLQAKAGWKQLGARLKRAKHAATLASLAPYVEKHGFYTNPSRANLISKIKAINPDISMLDLRPHLTKMRAIKQQPELEAIQKAINITATTLKQISKNIEKYKNEYEIEAALTASFRKRGAEGHAFSPIVAAGPNACTLHYLANNDSLQNAAGIVLDVGAEVNHYAADISRSYSLGKVSKRYREIYTAVSEVQDYAKSLLKPGVLMKDYEEQVEQFMGEKLRELGLIKSITHEHVRQFYPHATSHSLGLDVHDVFDYSQPLQPGMVLTVEPGIYVTKEGIGVRIEDDVLITENGIKVLSSKLSKELVLK